MDTFETILFIAIGLVWMLPIAIGMKRNAAHIAGIIIVDLIFGWTLIGWVIALIWAIYSPKEKQV